MSWFSGPGFCSCPGFHLGLGASDCSFGLAFCFTGLGHCLDLLPAAFPPPVQKRDAQHMFLQHRGTRRNLCQNPVLGAILGIGWTPKFQPKFRSVFFQIGVVPARQNFILARTRADSCNLPRRWEKSLLFETFELFSALTTLFLDYAGLAFTGRQMWPSDCCVFDLQNHISEAWEPPHPILGSKKNT